MAVPMKNGGIKPSKVIYYVVLSGELIPESNNLYKGRMSAVRKYVRLCNRIVCNDVIIKDEIDRSSIK